MLCHVQILPRFTLEWARNNLRVDDLKVFVLDEAMQTFCVE